MPKQQKLCVCHAADGIPVVLVDKRDIVQPDFTVWLHASDVCYNVFVCNKFDIIRCDIEFAERGHRRAAVYDLHAGSLPP